MESDTIDSLACKPKMKKFMNGYSNVVCHISSFLPGDEPIKLTQNVNSIKKQRKQKGKAINFTGVIRNLKKAKINLHKLCNSNHSKNDSFETHSPSTVLFVFQPIYHKFNLNQVCLLNDTLRKKIAHVFQ